LIWSPTTARYSFEALLLLAVLANYHRVDAASLNPYLKHIRETRDEVLMQRLLWVARFAFTRSVKAYRDLYDDTPPSFTSTVTSILSVFRPTLATTAPPPMKEIFSNQPIEATVILFPLFEFLSQNQAFRALFAQSVHPHPIELHALSPSSSRPQSPRPPLGSPRNSISTPLGSPRMRPGSLIMVGRSASMASVVQKAQVQVQAQPQQNEVRCAAELVSMASYVLAHAGTTGVGEGRAEAYARLVLDTMQQCVADEEIIRAMCSPPTKDDKAVWICRQYETVRAASTLRDLNKRKQNTKFARGLQDLLMTIDFYESQLEGTGSADEVMRVLAREIEKDGVHGVSAREREEPGPASDSGDVAFVRWACADGLALVS
ncbi:hypothetical protein FRC06_008768, partial [Ceratobasidium sp. 370]